MQFRALAACLVLLPILGCSKKESTSETTTAPIGDKRPPATATESAKPSASAATADSAPVTLGSPPACKILSQKSWGKGLNRETGLTARELDDGRVAVGAALGLTPTVLVVSKGGDGKMVKVAVKPGGAFAKAPAAADGLRHLFRVTPVKVTGDSATAFVDYRDEYKSKRRRVSCGAADTDESFVVFDDIPLLDMDPKPTGDARTALFKSKDADGDAGYHELRECRSFSDPKSGEVWVVGSDLRGFDQPDQTIQWKASLFVDKSPHIHESHLHDIDLKNDQAARVQAFDAPVSHRMHDGTFLLTARTQSALFGAELNADKSLHGDVKSWPGFATMPDLDDDGDDTVIVTSFVKAKAQFMLRGARVAAKSGDLPKALTSVDLMPDDKDSETDPDFTRDSKNRRWISYVDGQRGAGKLLIAPVDASFKATGKPFEITQDGEKASEARLVAEKDGTILVVFLRENDADKSVELVTEDLDCDVVN
jgi:hypothetical protein